MHDHSVDKDFLIILNKSQSANTKCKTLMFSISKQFDCFSEKALKKASKYTPSFIQMSF